MHARSVNFQARPESIDEGINFVKDEVMPAVMGMDGNIGLSFICDRESGRCISTSAWQSKDALEASDSKVAPLRDRGAEIFGGPPTVDVWEIAVLHRDAAAGDGASARCTWLSLDPEGINHATETYRMSTLPALEQLEGFCSASLMVDREQGRLVSTATFATREAMVASRSQADELRKRVAEDIGATITDVNEFELVLAHLHVPEMA